MNTMKTDPQAEAKIADETKHEVGCLEWGLEVLLENGATEATAMDQWKAGKTDCYCEQVRQLG